jgi:hypothetical protein
MAKIRKGFVSNSSSSSFIVAFPKGMELTEDNVHNYLYGPELTVICSYGDGIRSEQAAEVITRDMKEQTPNDEAALLSALGGWLEGAPDYDEYIDHKDDYSDRSDEAQERRRAQWDAYRKAGDEYRAKFLAKFKANVDLNKFDLYTFEYSDNDGSLFSTLEHGNTFDNAEYVRVSNH